MEIVLDKLARNFQAMSHDVSVLAKMPRNMGQPPNLPYETVYYPRSMSQVWMLGSTKQALLNQHRKRNFDIIHAHQAYPVGYVAVKLRRRLARPVVLTSHGGDIPPASRYSERDLIRRRIIWALSQADAATGVSNHLKAAIDRLTDGGANSSAIPNGVDLDFTPPSSSPPQRMACLRNQPFLLTLGRLHPSKGLDVLLKAFAALRKTRPDLPKLVLAGDGKERQYLEKLTAQLRLSEQVFFPGAVYAEEKAYLLDRCLFFLQPSRREGMPITVLEAMAAGKAVIGTDIGGIPELVVPKENGLLVPSESPQQLSDAIAQLLSNPGQLENMQAQASRRAGAYSWKRVCQRYLELYERLLSRWKKT